MIVTDKSSIITFAIPVFMLLILIEYCYGIYKGKSNYRLNDTFTSLSIGMISRYPTMLNLGLQSLIFVYISKYFNVGLLSIKNPMTWIIAFLLYDLSYYWMHRMHHEIKILWALIASIIMERNSTCPLLSDKQAQGGYGNGYFIYRWYFLEFRAKFSSL